MRWLLVLVVSACGFSTRTDNLAPGDGGNDGIDPDALDAGPEVCRAVEIEAMASQTCVRRNDGQVWCWGRNQDGAIGITSSITCANGDACVRVPTRVMLPEGIVRLGLGDRHSCALSSTKTYCWGFNGNGQFGDNSTNSGSTPRVIAPRAGTTALRGGDVHTCGLQGTIVRCSGKNQFGELGDTSTMQREAPTAAALVGVVTAIGAGYHHSCAIVAGAVSCWGQNQAGQVDNSGTNPAPTPRATGVTNATAVAGGEAHTCARIADRTVRCWGSNTEGQLGVDDTNVHAGVQPVTLPGVTQIVAGTDHTCALAGPDVYCWGQRFAASPTKVNLGAGAIAVAAGSGHDCAILADGTVRCWGANGFGQLGNNSTTGSTTPVQAVVCP